MSLKLLALVAFDLSMTLSQTMHVAASPSLLGTSEGVAEYRAPQCGQKKVRPSRTGFAQDRLLGKRQDRRLRLLNSSPHDPPSLAARSL
jgi:hypothetical protein